MVVGREELKMSEQGCKGEERSKEQAGGLEEEAKFGGREDWQERGKQREATQGVGKRK